MTHYDGCCRDLSAEEVRKHLEAGDPYVIRQKIPRTGVTGFDDVVYGHIEVNNSEMDDQILIKTDGMPTYNFANVVDDHLMGITHVIRGSEYLSSTPKYNLLYQAFGWEIPTYIHCPPVMKDAQNKLSKRNGDASYQDLVAKGYLSEAVMNYICLLGWSPKGEYAEQEIFSLPELVKATGKPAGELEPLLQQMAVVGLLEYNWENPRREKQYILPMFVPGSAEFFNMNKQQIADHPEVTAFFERMTFLPLEHITAMVPPGGAGIGMHVIPVEKAIETENRSADIEHISHWLKKYDGKYAAGPCSCRMSRAAMGEGCGDDPDDWCIGVGDMADGILRKV